MKIEDVMTEDFELIDPSASLREAALKMQELDCGFLPIGGPQDERLSGVVTDRDIVIRGIAEGLDPDEATVCDVKTDRILYCFRDNDLESATEAMRQNQVQRLVVIDSVENKKICGVISVGDIWRHHQEQQAAEAERGIKSHAA